MIIHKTIFRKLMIPVTLITGKSTVLTIGKEKRYLCNQAVKITPEKCSHYWKEVTCKNCLKCKRPKK